MTYRGGSVVTIGVFDGVHRGHRALIDAARRVADRSGLALVAVTFTPHPNAVVRPELDPPRLATLTERIDLLRAAGADGVHVVLFDEERSHQSAGAFVLDVLVERLAARTVVVGENFRFGHRAAGNVGMLRAAGAEHGFDVVGVPLLMHPEQSSGQVEPWSSTRIRAAIAAGDMPAAAIGLGRQPRVEGIVVHGDHRGRDLGFPTANLSTAAVDYDGLPAIPADGVYAGWLVAPLGGRLPTAVSVGTNPTFAGIRTRRVEAYVLDRDDLDLYGQRVAVDFVARLRGMEAFDDVGALVARMRADVEATRAALAAEPGG